MKTFSNRKTRDTIQIPGNYQYQALTEGNSVQRFWHLNKQICIDRFLPPNPSENILDVGCGSGVVSAFLAKNGANVVGIDGNSDAVTFARQQFHAPNLSFECRLVDEDFEVEKPLDKIYCLELIEHIYQHQARKMLQQFYNLLSNDGCVFISTPNYRSPWPAIEWIMDTLKVAPQLENEQHVEFYNQKKLGRLCEDVGFTIKGLVTTCFAAPWIAPLNWELAQKINVLETNCRLIPGCIIICILQKKSRVK
jgi:2-polyprenyl-3-methyl-5-hydroxy-6-metoxy-1,4-benzoquinol methylase